LLAFCFCWIQGAAAASQSELTLIRIFQALFAIGFVLALGLFAFLALAPPGTEFGVFANSRDDKLGHFLAFFVLGPLAVAAFPRLRLVWMVILLAIAGAALEAGQGYSGREISAEDMAANLLGLAAGLFPLAAYRLRLAYNRQRPPDGGAGT
jgi:hypothetical protein